jgi:nucleoid-associated protein YgaU
MFTRATITFLKGSKAGKPAPDGVVTVMFNPAEYNFGLASNFSSTALPGLNNPVLQFVHGEAQTLSMDLLFDTYTNEGGAEASRRDVSKRTADFARAVLIDGDLHAPPPVRFDWGSFTFNAVVEKLTQRFTMFLDDGTPVRAMLNVSFKQYQPIREQLENPRRTSADKTARHELSSDESLWALAAAKYGEPRFWRQIARANRVANPRRLLAGSVLILPPLEEINAPDRP